MDTDTVMVRGRCREHLCSLQERLPALAACEIVATPGRDYACRIIVPKRVWAAVLFDLAAEQEWSNFKNEAAEFQGNAGAAYVHALHDVWTRMARLQVPQRNGRIERNAGGAIVNADDLTADDVAHDKVLCPACGEKVFLAWPEGWDGHAGWKCPMIHGATPEERKANYKARFRRLFR
jgi:ribosomal protein S27AE